MARLSKTERGQLKKPAERQSAPLKPPPPPPPVSPRSYMEFATFAARFNRSAKPVRFGGDHWKL